MKITRLESWIIVCAVVLSTCAGCNSLGGKLSDSDGRFNPLKRFTSKKEQEPEFQIPKSMVGIWKTSTFEKAGSKSIRGFGGRFYFYDANNEPVRVNGDLTIYGYDDNNQAESGDGKADRKFVFKADSLNTHFSESAFGESYSFFVPWDNVGGEEKTITLIPVFKTVEGHMPEAKPATMRLPGRRVSKSAAMSSKKKSANPVVQASAELPSALPVGSTITSPIPRKKQARRMPTTLRLPPRLAERLAAPVQRTTSPASTGTTGFSAETTQSATADETPVNNESADHKISQTQEVGRTENRATTRVFGQPGAFH